jgi:hypothetical protein
MIGLFDDTVSLTPLRRAVLAIAFMLLVWGSLPVASSTALAATTGLSMTTSTETPTAGTAFSVTVTAVDENGSPDATYAGTVHFVTNDMSSDVVLPADSPLTDGQRTFSLTLITAGSWPTITVSDDASSLTTTINLTVVAASSDHFVLSLRTGPMAGYPFTFLVIAQDRYGNLARSYPGTAHFTTSDPSAGVVMPPDSTVNGGRGTFSATLDKAGPQTVTATDTAMSSLTGTLTVGIRPGPAAAIQIGAPAAVNVGQPFDITVTLRDRFGNVATGAGVPYTGTIHFTSSDALATLPADYTFEQSYYTADTGTRSFTATLVTAGEQTIAATDTVNASITGTSPSIQVMSP